MEKKDEQGTDEKKVLLPPTTKAKGIGRLVGFILFTIPAFLTMENVGYTRTDVQGIEFDGGFLSDTNLLIINISLGLIGGILLFTGKMIPAIIAGIIATTLTTFLIKSYMSFRVEMFYMELVIPFLISVFTGIFVFRLLRGKQKIIN